MEKDSSYLRQVKGDYTPTNDDYIGITVEGHLIVSSSFYDCSAFAGNNKRKMIIAPRTFSNFTPSIINDNADAILLANVKDAKKKHAREKSAVKKKIEP